MFSTTIRVSETGRTHRVVNREHVGPTVTFDTTACGRVLVEHLSWAAGDTVTCIPCLRAETCKRGHISCGTPTICAQLARRIPAEQIINGDRVYVTGRWQVLTRIRHEGGAVHASTDRGGRLVTSVGRMFDVER